MNRKFIEEWAPKIRGWQFEGKRLADMTNSELRALLGYSVTNGAKSAARLRVLRLSTVDAPGIRGWLIRLLAVGYKGRVPEPSADGATEHY